MFVIQAHGAFEQGLGGFGIKPGEGIGTQCHRSRATFECRAELCVPGGRWGWEIGVT